MRRIVSETFCHQCSLVRWPYTQKMCSSDRLSHQHLCQWRLDGMRLNMSRQHVHSQQVLRLRLSWHFVHGQRQSKMCLCSHLSQQYLRRLPIKGMSVEMQWQLCWSNWEEMCRCLSHKHLCRLCDWILWDQLFSRLCHQHWKQHVSIRLCSRTLQKPEKQFLLKFLCWSALCRRYFKKLCLSMHCESFDFCINFKWQKMRQCLFRYWMAWHVRKKMCNKLSHQHFCIWIQSIMSSVLSWTITLLIGSSVCDKLFCSEQIRWRYYTHMCFNLPNWVMERSHNFQVCHKLSWNILPFWFAECMHQKLSVRNLCGLKRWHMCYEVFNLSANVCRRKLQCLCDAMSLVIEFVCWLHNVSMRHRMSWRVFRRQQDQIMQNQLQRLVLWQQ